MTKEEKLRFMYEAVHGSMQTNSSAEIEVVSTWSWEEDREVLTVECTKDGILYWTMTREEVLFDYLTRDLNDKRLK